MTAWGFIALRAMFPEDKFAGWVCAIVIWVTCFIIWFAAVSDFLYVEGLIPDIFHCTGYITTESETEETPTVIEQL